MAVTFAGLISQDQNPLSCCWVPSHPWLLPGNPKWLDQWDGCQPHCWKTSQHQLTHPLSTSTHLLSPVPYLASQHLEAIGSVCPPSEHPAVGLAASTEVTDLPRVKATNTKVQPCHLQQGGAFSEERSLNFPASPSWLYTILWIFLDPKRGHRLIPCAPQKLSHHAL